MHLIQNKIHKRTYKMFHYLYKLFAHFLVGLSINLIIFYLVSKTEDISKKLISFNTLLVNIREITVLFSLFAVFDIVWNFYFSNTLVNTSLIYIFIICFFGDLFSVFLILLATFGTYCFIITFYETVIISSFNIIIALLIYNFSIYAKNRRHIGLHIFFAAIVASSLYLIFISFIYTNYSIFGYRIEEFSMPIIFINVFGIIIFFKVFEEAFYRGEYYEGITAKIALNIINESFPIIEKGLTEDNAFILSNLILNNIKSFDIVAITSKNKILGLSTYEKENSFIEYLKKDILRILNKKFSVNNNFNVLRTFSFGILRNDSGIIGYIIVGHIVSKYITVYEGNIVNSIAAMISEQLRIYNLNNVKRLLSAAEIKALQAQINSHFLFNALNTISYYCSCSPSTAKILINHLANYYRQNISESEQLISINKELQHVNAYIQIELARFNTLTVEYDIDESCMFKVPPFILQPIVENAIKHGVRNNLDGGIIKIIIKQSFRCYHIYVIDNGIGIPGSKLKNIFNSNNQSIGLSNINQRLISLYGIEYTLIIISRVNFGTIVHIKIPKGE